MLCRSGHPVVQQVICSHECEGGWRLPTVFCLPQQWQLNTLDIWSLLSLLISYLLHIGNSVRPFRHCCTWIDRCVLFFSPFPPWGTLKPYKHNNWHLVSYDRSQTAFVWWRKTLCNSMKCHRDRGLGWWDVKQKKRLLFCSDFKAQHAMWFSLTRPA